MVRNLTQMLFQALRESKYYGIAKIAMHNRGTIVILRPGNKGVLLHTMYYADEIRQWKRIRTDTTQVKEKELALAKSDRVADCRLRT